MVEIDGEYDEYGNLKRFLKKKPEEWKEVNVDVAQSSIARQDIPQSKSVIEKVTDFFSLPKPKQQSLTQRVKAESKQVASIEANIANQIELLINPVSVTMTIKDPVNE
jgi:chromatin segregation and condensation protein Rec8/ScpA/Scc1 (kleisin family)